MNMIKKIIQSRTSKTLFLLVFFGGNLLLAFILSIIHISLNSEALDIPWANISEDAYGILFLLTAIIFALNILFLGNIILLRKNNKQISYHIIEILIPSVVNLMVIYNTWFLYF